MQYFNYALAVFAQHCTSWTKIASDNVQDEIVTRHSGGFQASSFVPTSRVAPHTSLSVSKERYPRVDVSFHFSSLILRTIQQCEVSMKPPNLIGDQKVI
jgi:hypothetical protein